MTAATVEAPLLVLAGGFGTRLRSVVGDRPKPLAPVAGEPFLRHLLRQWFAQGVRRFVLLLHYEHAMVSDLLRAMQAAGELEGARIETVVEEVPLGTGGAIVNAVRACGIAGEFLVANADTWLGGGIAEIAHAPAPAMALVRVADGSRYGCVELAGDQVGAFAEKGASTGGGWINAGIYKFDTAALPAAAGAFSLEQVVLPELAASGAIAAVCLETTFFDIGVPQDYFRFEDWFASHRRHGLT